MSLPALPQLPDLETLRQLPSQQLVSLIVQQQQGTLAAAKGNRAIDTGAESTQGHSESSAGWQK